ncbi:Fe-only nitrogenase accessory protein AnfO [Clostridium pasteurianum DSM 525 = ATCC 6013]|nr:Fe-only nitrogenase accessory protein AnfO [Clostridium pasteurianum]AJA47501.1 Fe-only nitrogenase accessory protein AnfO [Clostridium pasteurianum DSM 525 = ATCC 6013]AJA51489.1 Fe-only nitrogenase accessory protein AnfO [Clostridium pasteurianum DSM 525 = ATCC 6013]AOZ74820.1 Fe-only nitrogenase accessory protein AnfO [Clostridium pasteurianum DSM 525 = ATCC 6013]AOZ78616.1 Fe-only nitrogenase accessory protein AnfO [Clostridium pasteurianum]ELP57663.1 nitrogenase iron-iron accessory pro
MFNEVAVLVGKDGNTGSVYDSGMIVIYEKKEEGWRVKSKTIFNLSTSNGMGAVREKMLMITEDLGDCSIFLGKRVDGIPYSVLKKSGFVIAEADGNPEEFLDELMEMIIESKEKEAKRRKAQDTVIEPIALEKQGEYFINLERVQNNNPGISSKKILQPFLKNKPFRELKIVCNHIPKWIENELMTLGMKFEVKKLTEGEFEVKVYNQFNDEKTLVNR